MNEQHRRLIEVAATVRDMCPGRPRDPRVLELIRQLEERFDQECSVPSRAANVHLSTSRISHLFKAETGWTFHRYANYVRLTLSKYLLETSWLSIKEIAAATGMDARQMTREFKATFGESPRRFRAHSTGS